MKIYPCRRGWIGAVGEWGVFHWGEDEEEDFVESTGFGLKLHRGWLRQVEDRKDITVNVLQKDRHQEGPEIKFIQ